MWNRRGNDRETAVQFTAELTIATIILVFTACASGGALYVSMKVSGSISNFRNELVKELDERYVRKAEHSQVEAMRNEMEESRRNTARDRLAGVEVELHRYRDDLDITLRGILAAINETRAASKQRT